MKRFLIVLFVGALVIGGWRTWSNHRPLPRLEFKDAQSQAVTLDDMLEGKSRGVFLFLLPGCDFSRASMRTAKDAYPEYGDRVAFVGFLMTGDSNSAEQFRKDNDLPFPVYALRSASDPYAVNEMMSRVGSWRGVYGGTTVVVDSRRRPVFTSSQEETRKLPEVLHKQRI